MEGIKFKMGNATLSLQEWFDGDIEIEMDLFDDCIGIFINQDQAKQLIEWLQKAVEKVA